MKFESLFEQEYPVFIIAEVGNNHNGSFDRAIELIDLAKSAGADCVKFQMRNARALYREKSLQKDSDDLGSEYITDLLSRFELDIDQHQKLFEYTKEVGIEYMCTPWDTPSMDVLAKFGVKAVKVASADLTNLPLLTDIANHNLPIILSTGMSTEKEIKITVTHLNDIGAKFFLLHCNSTYPAPFDDINLSWLGKLKEIHPHIGYSGHERGTAVSIAAVAYGARVLERHFTLDRHMEGPDHAASLEPYEFERLVTGVREVERAIGSSQHKRVSQGELINRENLAKSLILTRNLQAGHLLCREDITIKSPGQGLSPQRLEEVLGRPLLKAKLSDDFLFESDVFSRSVNFDPAAFRLTWGIPVRPHDANKFISIFSPEMVEFHFSYSDLTLTPSDYISAKQHSHLVVHAPELFDNSHLLDLTSPDEDYRSISIENMRKLISVTKSLNEFFPNTTVVQIVTNVGGFSMDEPIPTNLHSDYYTRLAQSLEQLKTPGIEIIPQTMAPFPWHFGGQRLQNLFVFADDIVRACKDMNLRICLDISHSKLTCNTHNLDFEEFLKAVLPYVAHLHLGDASGQNGEGLQIGHGDIDFMKVGEIVGEHCQDASFIPEIWQGHKDEGLGFKVALNRLQGLF